MSFGRQSERGGGFQVGKGESRSGVARNSAETEQTGRTQEVSGSLLWTHLSDSAFRAGRPQREEDRETGSAIKTLSGREQEKKPDEG